MGMGTSKWRRRRDGCRDRRYKCLGVKVRALSARPWYQRTLAINRHAHHLRSLQYFAGEREEERDRSPDQPGCDSPSGGRRNRQAIAECRPTDRPSERANDCLRGARPPNHFLKPNASVVCLYVHGSLWHRGGEKEGRREGKESLAGRRRRWECWRCQCKTDA